jgi:hypothetical protein
MSAGAFIALALFVSCIRGAAVLLVTLWPRSKHAPEEWP